MPSRRKFLSYLPAAATASALLGLGVQAATAEPEPRAVGAIETLMRGHGLLLRAVIIYDTIKDRIEKGEAVDPALILRTSAVFSEYLEGFHEKAEEKYIFDPMEKAKLEFASIQDLKIQHGAGFELTQRITSLAKAGRSTPELSGYLDAFGKMYRHHIAWEDTVIFPAFDSLENKRQLAEVAANLEAEEKKALGGSGFGTFVDAIAEVEKRLGIFELSKSTPQLS